MRLQPSVAMNTDRRSVPRPTVAQSACICWPGSVSNLMIGSATGSRKERTHELLHPRHAAPVSPLLDLTEQNRCRDPCRRRRTHTVDDVVLEVIKLLSSLRRRLACTSRLSTAQIAPHRVPRVTRHPRQLPDTRAVLAQNRQLHPTLHLQHQSPRNGGTT